MSAPGPTPPMQWPPQRRRVLDWRALVVGMLIGGLAAIVICGPRASAAELDPRKRPHDLWLLVAPVEDRPSIFKLGTDYADRDACEKAKRRLVVKVAGTLQCHAVTR